MPTPFATIDGNRATAVRVHVPHVGVWWAEVQLEEAPELEGAVTIALGSLALAGTIDARASGSHGLSRSFRVIGGAGGWSTLLAPKAYHNDAGVKASVVAADAAREAGESISTFMVSTDRIGIDYVRSTGPAASVLESVIAGAAWWVDYEGNTHVGAREEIAATEDAYEVLDVVPDQHLITLAVDDLTRIVCGSVLTKRLDAPETVRELEIEVTGDTVRVKAWCGAAGRGGRLGAAIRSVVRRSTDDRLFGVSKYRVVQMSSGRVELQAVRRSAGLPDIHPISMWGAAGIHAELTPGSECLVQFVDGDRTQPVITGFVGKGGPGFVPSRILLGASDSAPNAAREGDTVRVTIPASTVVIAVSGGAGTLNPNPIELDGEITSGSSKVGIG